MKLYPTDATSEISMKSIILWLLCCVIFVSCNQDESEEVVPVTDEEDPVDITALISATQQQVQVFNEAASIVDKVAEEGDNYILSFFKQEDSLRIPKTIVTEVKEQPDAWKLFVQYVNEEQDSLLLRGTSIGISGDDIDVDPYDRSPLTALASFPLPFKGNIRVEVLGKGNDGIAIGHTFSNNTNAYQIPVLGLYENYSNSVAFHFLDVAGNELSIDTVTIRTERINRKSNLNIVKNNLPQEEDMVYMEVGIRQAFDQNGELRWALTDGSFNELFDRLPNGDWTLSSYTDGQGWHFAYFHQVTMLGEIIETYEVPNLGHHEIKVIGGGESFLVGTNSVKVTSNPFGNDGNLQEDVVVEISASTGEIIQTYDFNVMLDNSRSRIVGWWTDDWFHNNAIEYDLGADETYGTSDDAVICSGRHQCTVFKFNKNTSEIQWILADRADWPAHLHSYLLTPVDANGNALDVSDIDFWPYGQHTPKVLPNGNIMLFDNGNERGFYKNQVDQEYSRAVEYKIDEENMTIELVWVYDYGQQIFTDATGDTDYLPESDGRLISFMRANNMGGVYTPRVVELDKNGQIIFEATITETLDRQLYRAEKFNLYEGLE